jgi:hypothetical protein
VTLGQFTGGLLLSTVLTYLPILIIARRVHDRHLLEVSILWLFLIPGVLPLLLWKKHLKVALGSLAWIGILLALTVAAMFGFLPRV